MSRPLGVVYDVLCKVMCVSAVGGQWRRDVYVKDSDLLIKFPGPEVWVHAVEV